MSNQPQDSSQPKPPSPQQSPPPQTRPQSLPVKESDLGRTRGDSEDK